MWKPDNSLGTFTILAFFGCMATLILVLAIGMMALLGAR